MHRVERYGSYYAVEDRSGATLATVTNREEADAVRAALDERDALRAACKSVLAWADREAMPAGGKHDGPWAEIEAALGGSK